MNINWLCQHEQDRQCQYNVTMRRVRLFTVNVEKQCVHILSLCLLS